MSKENKKNPLIKFITFFVLFSFLFPRGYLEYNQTYKTIYTYLVWAATFLIWFQFIVLDFKFKISKKSLILSLYFIFSIIITLSIRGIKIDGLQKLFAYPSICLFTINNFKKNPQLFLNTIINIFILNLLGNQIILRSFFSEQFHITYLGHVQMIAQYCILALFCALVDNIIYNTHKKKNIFLIVLALITLVTTDASTSTITLIILCIFLLLYKMRLFRLFEHSSPIYFNIIQIITIAIIYMSMNYYHTMPALAISGRCFVWKDAIKKFLLKPIYGYGIEGVMIDTFWNAWTNPEGFNYAHNQIVQNLLDGGIIIAILYYIMFISFIKNIKNVQNDKIKIIINIAIILYSLIMIVESTSLYCYIYIFLGMIYSLSNSNIISNKIIKE